MRTIAEIITRLSALTEQRSTQFGHQPLSAVLMPGEEGGVLPPIPAYETLYFWAIKHYHGKLSAEEISLLLNYYLITLACNEPGAQDRPRAVHNETLYHFQAFLDEFAY